ncbi:MAG: hypothetical protein QNJ40_24650 [Xanthomonadales bacterium]|nr:hypothetical protein [Xanthomonadales bacterium]
MKKTLILMTVFMLSTSAAFAQADDDESLKIAALEALISAPADRAFPIVSRVLKGSGSTELKSRALFVLSQMDHPQSLQLLLETAQADQGGLSLEAIRMIGINGDREAIAQLGSLYTSAGPEMQRAILDAYLIANDTEAVYQLALAAKTPEEFDQAVDILGAMGAREELRKLRDKAGSSQRLIEAFAVSGDVEILSEMAADGSDQERQLKALRALGIAGGNEVNDVLVQAYSSSDSPEIKRAALDGLLVSGHDEGVLALFQASGDPEEKRQLLQTLMAMGSDAVWDIIDQTLDGDE